MPRFSHLHVHTQYSLLDGAAPISALFTKAAKDGMPALAISDHGNMFGVFQFVAEAWNHPSDPTNKKSPPKVKPIVGCEFYITENRHRKTFSKGERDPRYHQILLAKDEMGYRNLMKLSSLGFIEGMYSKYPRIDKELIHRHHQGLIATTCCLGALVPQAILKKSEEEAENEFKWWLNIFQDDYYVELQRHGLPEQDRVNALLLGFARKYGVKVIASNDSHYVDQSDFNAHDILLCINTGEKLSTPALREFSDYDLNVRDKRFAFPNDQFYLKSTEEMQRTFQDLEEAIDNTNEIVDKVELLDLKRDILLPHFTVPTGFDSQDAYLEHLTWEGARQRYAEMTPEVEERLRFELFTIRTMGFAGYFLIVSDFIRAGRELGVFIGPGRGSAAGSAVAYCIGITNIDPIKYRLLFERFLNPDRKSMPDIDTDFDDDGRQKVIDYVVSKYGRNQVAQIVTYGTMAAKMSIKDVARVMDLPLPESNALAKLVPEKPGISLKRVLHAPFSGSDQALVEKNGLNPDDLENVKRIREVYGRDDLSGRVLREAEILEGSLRNTSIHAAGIIIAPQDLTELVPVCTAKDSPLWVTQIEGNLIEKAGVLKMDFLGLKTLNILKTTLELVRQHHGLSIDLDHLPLDDAKTFQLYQRAETIGTFQFESPGMQKYLRELKPDNFDDLIAMNALYRPGPMEYIPNYIDRKHGREVVSYDLPEMEEFLQESYGITVYQEQVMLLAQKLAGFTKGDADVLRKAMGKKDKPVLDQMRPRFMEGAAGKGHPKDKLEKIWTDWEAFAQYAFNKSHSTCYAMVAYQTAYLKANYPSEYMAAVLNHAGNIDKITFFMEECRRMGITVLGPDMNESQNGFAVNSKGEIRIGLGGLKGVGEAAVEAIIEDRRRQGPFQTVFDLVKRVNQRVVNRKSLECLAMSGALDFDKSLHRAQYFHLQEGESVTGLEKIIRYGNIHQSQSASAANTLFGDLPLAYDIPLPRIIDCPHWSLTELLDKEKEITGIFLSGHPLDHFRFEMIHYGISTISDYQHHLAEVSRLPQPARAFRLAGLVTGAQHRISRNATRYGVLTLEDFTGKIEITLFSDQYIRYANYFENGNCLFVAGRFEKREFRDEWQFRISDICLLETIKKVLTRRLQLSFQPRMLEEQHLAFFEKNLREHPGKARLKFVISDRKEAQSIVLSTFDKGFEMNDELTHFLQENPQWEVNVEYG
ncbi:MAG: DNA polymerase III subunit alpha [Bacteroidetes bacterium]|nr:DNA polymerase III subunit alpha [Bacteroidota bacterium]